MSFEATYEQNLALCVDVEFQRRVASDELLNRLVREKEMEPEEEIVELRVFMGAGLVLCGKVPVRPPTAGVVALLSLVKSPFVTGDYSKYEDLDVDKALWILTMGRDAFKHVSDPMVDLASLCGHMVPGLGLGYLEMWSDIRLVIRQAFAPLKMLSGDGGSEFDVPYFDSHWLAGVVARICRVTNESMDRVMWEIPLVTLNHLAVCDDKWNGVKGIARVTKMDKAWERQCELQEERLREMGLLCQD